MHDDTTTSEMTEQSPAETSTVEGQTVIHSYCETSGEVLAKPGILCDFIEAEGQPRTLVFCNAPSDADFIDVILRKRGIRSTKLIGHVPQNRISRAMQELEAGTTKVLVVTDISAQAFSNESFELIINFGIPTDSDTYLERAVKNHSGSYKVISLVGPLDFGNFHFLKKTAELEFTQIQPPPQDAIVKRAFSNLCQQTLQSPGQHDERSRSMARMLLAGEAGDAGFQENVLTTLFYNTLNAVVAAPSAGPSDSDDRHERPARGGDFRGRQDRGPRRDNRDNRDNFRAREQGEDFEDGDYQDRGRDNGPRGQRQDRGERDDRRGGQRPPPPPKDLRFYVGHGTRSGFTSEELTGLLRKNLEGTEVDFQDDMIHRVIVRDLYTFVDFQESVGLDISNALHNVRRESGEEFYICKTVTIPGPRSAATEEGEGDNGNGHEAGAEESFEDEAFEQ